MRDVRGPLDHIWDHMNDGCDVADRKRRVHLKHEPRSPVSDEQLPKRMQHIYYIKCSGHLKHDPRSPTSDE